MLKPIGVYVHIPFCKRKCYYCDFVSFAKQGKIIEEYINALIKEIKNFDFSKYSIETLYIGGGTPSVIESKYISMIMDELTPFISENAEITIEVNPRNCRQTKANGV